MIKENKNTENNDNAKSSFLVGKNNEKNPHEKKHLNYAN